MALLRRYFSPVLRPQCTAILSRFSTNPSEPSETQGTDGRFVRGPGSFASTHWLDKRIPGAREWLEKQNRLWWIHGLKYRCKEHVELRGNQEDIPKFVDEQYKAYLNVHKHMIVDGRSQTHVQTACMVLATYKVFKAYIKDDEELLKIVRDHMGGMTRPLIRALLHINLFVRAKLMRSDPFDAMVRMMKTLQLDMGTSFKCSFTSNHDSAILDVKNCSYHEIFLEEGVPQLTSCCCCSIDAVWFDDMEAHKVGYLRTNWLADGDSKCTMSMRRINH